MASSLENCRRIKSGHVYRHAKAIEEPAIILGCGAISQLKNRRIVCKSASWREMAGWFSAVGTGLVDSKLAAEAA
jgi:hypothetical protein